MSKLLQDELFLKLALNLAKKGLGWTNPNPMVGAVLVKNGQIIGTGFHKKAGLDHAEIAAIKSAKTDVKDATLYVNLEPCSHFGKTPPCADEIIRNKIKKVICSTLDPNPQVRNQGVIKLRQARIEVSIGLLNKEARRLNEAFFTFHERKRPFVAIKFASSLDGKIATPTGNSKWITNEKARTFARKLRGQYQSVLVGINTILKDNPNLGVKTKSNKDPLRIILDSNLKIPLNSDVLRDHNVLIATTTKANKKSVESLEQKGIPLITFKEKHIPIRKLLRILWQKEIISILVEGGGKVLGSFLDNRSIDKIYAFYAPILLGGESAVSAIGGKGVQTITDAWHLKKILYKRFDDNFLISGDV
ncbi:bifunctional diaminohydroxyphosphoribosylaminopyrimidine deaminase/5-amino-6-(5-phosphoribosylamino)uracil reductase RibD [Candidatus Daviesbacteria bacterium]|nr:bifunctional diaminohydroxyphosphoribosylaminopyrimidine deaminase/5-amino-6-(5-phosphoribosylamino)uracil reductase RibD [Candidatus Daviesbacteria bacterium]